ncbi:hypothetical protein SKAU_G00010730 [Synaphobranchus kaupii]|uniref:Uncharacterized protein n=1 Tax=Synaphobranchus kaupii TaxID=118154 RepID=A0A9Q1JCX4_SYNKA|nr:hypothetical protein SKAU_G00010730 [Synaphobranchus kaupii]
MCQPAAVMWPGIGFPAHSHANPASRLWDPRRRHGDHIISQLPPGAPSLGRILKIPSPRKEETGRAQRPGGFLSHCSEYGGVEPASNTKI